MERFLIGCTVVALHLSDLEISCTEGWVKFQSLNLRSVRGITQNTSKCKRSKCRFYKVLSQWIEMQPHFSEKSKMIIYLFPFISHRCPTFRWSDTWTPIKDININRCKITKFKKVKVVWILLLDSWMCADLWRKGGEQRVIEELNRERLGGYD